MNTLPRPRPLVVVILDGWGINQQEQGNAIAAAKTPTFDLFARHFPTTSIVASGLEVGLPPGVGGNSETGHRNIGAGRVEYQILAHIDRTITDGSFFQNDVLLDALKHAENNNTNLHVMGLLSTGGVHAHINHLFALLELARKKQFKRPVYLHLFTDGRDSPPQSALQYLVQLEAAQAKMGLGTIASLVGRFFAMDRNNNWDRTRAAYELLVGGQRERSSSSARRVIERSYSEGITDEEMLPTAITRAGIPIGTISDGDAVIFFNFRPDRARQLVRAFMKPEEMPFPTRKLRDLYFATLVQYDPAVPVPAAFQESKAEAPLARVISEAGLKQLHIAETEKYAHVTYYLNVGEEAPFTGEDRILIRSSNVKNFSQKPEMEAGPITDAVLESLKRGVHDVYFINYANGDMVGHTGNFAAAVTACEAVDTSLGRIAAAIKEADGALVVTADHGKVEALTGERGEQKKTEHTTNPVPLYYVREELRRTAARSDAEVAALWQTPVGVLADVAPTLLDILRLEKPRQMTGVSLLGSMQ
jgi:2,3-bisphosphoglycerate-independent phosphoglycerate mutase